VTAPAPSSFAGGRYQVRRFLGEGGKKRVFLARSLAPELVTPQDVLAFDLDAQPVEPTAAGASVR